MMKDNKVVISKKNDGSCTVTLNGLRIDKVVDFSYSKSSATKSTELTLKIDVDELEENFR